MTTEEDLLQEQYRGNRHSTQLHLGYSYSSIHQQGSLWGRGRGKVTRVISVGSSTFTSSGCIHSSVEHQWGFPAWIQTAEKYDHEVGLQNAQLRTSWRRYVAIVAASVPTIKVSTLVDQCQKEQNVKRVPQMKIRCPSSTIGHMLVNLNLKKSSGNALGNACETQPNAGGERSK